MPKTKFIWALALVALCALLIPGVARAQEDHWAVALDEWMDNDAEEYSQRIEVYAPGMVWDSTNAFSATLENTGTTTWTTDYDLRAVDGGVVVPRWGVASWPEVGASVAPTETADFAANMIAPPITTLGYTAPVGDTDPGAPTAVEGTWFLTNLGTLITPDDDPAGGDVTLGRFKDVVPYMDVDIVEDDDQEEHEIRTVMPAHWAFYWIEECAGRAPVIVLGYPDGNYRPSWPVTRGAMAVYIQRAMKIPTVSYAESLAFAETTEGVFPEDEDYDVFPDVPEGHWAEGSVYALVMDDRGSEEDEDLMVGPGAEVIAGYEDGNYWPDWVVTRGQMAVYIARAKAYDVLADDELIRLQTLWSAAPTVCTMDKAADTVTSTAHGLAVDDVIAFTASTGGVAVGSTYFVVAVPTVDTFQFSTELGGTAFDIDYAGSDPVFNGWRTMFSDPVDGVMDADDDTVTSIAHGLALDDPIVFDAATGGVTVGATYYVLDTDLLDDDTFQISDTVGGAPLDITADGDNTWRAIAGWVWFPDVPAGFWCDGEVYACALEGVVAGYADGYRPSVTVDRGQMAVYIWRAFIGAAESGVPVVLAGPATGNEDPASATYVGVPTSPGDPIFAWVGFDALRLDEGLAYDGDWNLRFKYCEGTGATEVAVVGVAVDPADITAAKTAAQASGVPYYYVTTTVPGLPAGNYNLRVDVEDENGDMFELPRTALLSSSVMPPPPNCPRPPDEDSPDLWMAVAGDYGDGIRTPLGGQLMSAMADSDDTYYTAELPTGDTCCVGYGDTYVWHDIPAEATALRVTLEYHIDPTGPGPWDCCLGNPCEVWATPPLDGATDPPYGFGVGVVDWDDPYTVQWYDDCGNISCPADDDIQNPFLGHPLTDQTYTWESTDVANFLSAEGDVAVHFCGGAGSLLIDQLVLSYALPPTPMPPTDDDPAVWNDVAGDWGDGNKQPMVGASLGQMAAKDGLYYRTKLTVYPVLDDSSTCCTIAYGETVSWDNIPSDALDLTVALTYHGEKIPDYTCCGSNPCEAWGGSQLDPEEAPWPGYNGGGGLWMVDWDDPWAVDWYDTGGGGCGDTSCPAEEDVQNPFMGHPLSDQSFTWTSTNVANFVDDPDLDGIGTVAIHWCGQAGGILNIDECTLVYTPGPASPPVWPICP